MLEAVVGLLIWICIVAIVIYLCLWVIQTIAGVPLPAKVVQLLWVIFALVVILYLVRLLAPMYPHTRWP